jgi:hypothetical protein
VRRSRRRARSVPLRTGLSALHAAFDSAGYDLTKLPPGLVINLGSRDVLDARHSIHAYLAKACGLR